MLVEAKLILRIDDVRKGEKGDVKSALTKLLFSELDDETLYVENLSNEQNYVGQLRLGGVSLTEFEENEI